MKSLDAPTRELVSLATVIAIGVESAIEARCRTSLATGVPPIWVEELLLQSVLMLGWPRTLNAAAIWRRVSGPTPAPGEDGTDYSMAADWLERGEVVCRMVYGANYERLRQNVRAMHPSLEAWMLVEGYGRTLGRPGLDLARRELCVIAQVAVQGAERQLHSHLRGALNAGAEPSAVAEALEIVRPLLGRPEEELMTTLWNRIRA
ncbi:MAG: carboxymuconolactone decarboxylase family protein [Gemmatimonadales bacterium]|nr:carboxymuconolactone decarboxylase family protein [Gemmatimonadales bacterium]